MNTAVAFVNIFGDKVDTTKRVKLAKRESTAPDKFHKGWRVVGVSPEAIEAARRDRDQAINAAIKRNAGCDAGISRIGRTMVPSPFDEAKWIEAAPLKPARTKPFEIPEAAQQCFDLAKKAGWLRLEIRLLSKGAP
jgi:hypothetical protein